jgi:hypothetical protein
MMLPAESEMNRQRKWLPTLLVWAMLPLTVLSGFPRSACLCSNGELKVACHAAQASRSCCADHGSLGRAAQHSAPPLLACCHGSGSSPNSPATCTLAGCHCTPVVVLPDASPKVETTTAPELEVAANHVGDDKAHALHRTPRDAVGFHPAPPAEGRDLVILLSRMLA